MTSNGRTAGVKINGLLVGNFRNRWVQPTLSGGEFHYVDASQQPQPLHGSSLTPSMGFDVQKHLRRHFAGGVAASNCAEYVELSRRHGGGSRAFGNGPEGSEAVKSGSIIWRVAATDDGKAADCCQPSAGGADPESPGIDRRIYSVNGQKDHETAGEYGLRGSMNLSTHGLGVRVSREHFDLGGLRSQAPRPIQ
jgi:hypothetical protein